MRHVFLCVGLSLSIGCNKGGAWLDPDELSCGRNPFDWFGGLSRHVDRGEVGEGEVSFDYAPPEERIGSIYGVYNTSSGDFSYTANYLDYYLDQDNFSGYGTVFQNGALDILYTVTRSDVLGAVEVYEVREERYACEGYIERWAVGDGGETSLAERVDYVIADDGRVDYDVSRDGADGYRSGSWSSDMSDDYYDEWYLADEDYFAEGVATGAGEVNEDLARFFPDVEYYGDSSYSIWGDETSNYTGYQPGDEDVYVTVYQALDYDGSGGASYQYADGDTCDITFYTDGSCDEDCTGGRTYGC